MPAILPGGFGNFSHSEMDLLQSALLPIEVTKGACLLKPGQVCQSLYFISSGSFIQFKEKDEIDQQIIDLHVEQEWMLNQQSFVKQQSSETFIQAYANSNVYELTITALHELINRSSVFFQLARLLEPTPSRVKLFDDQLSPTEKYQFVLDHRPSLLQAFPLKIIASYLKITPETLSRVREKISNR
jgi:CRP-like cAMP-binding protein